MWKLGKRVPELAIQLEYLRRVVEHRASPIQSERPCASQALQSIKNDWRTAEAPEVRSLPLLIELHIDDHAC
jgi:hypothetical protein